MEWDRRGFLGLALLASTAQLLDAKRVPRKRSKQLLSTLDVFSTEHLRPAPPKQALDPLLNAYDPPALSMTATFGGETRTEYLPYTAERVALEQYLRTSVASDTIIFVHNHLPYASFTLSDRFLTRERWEHATELEQRDIMVDAGKALSAAIKRKTGLRDLTWRIGHADTLAGAIRRYSRFAPYFENDAISQGIDPRAAYIAFVETNFRERLVSSADCEGPFQLSRPVARRFGLKVPRGVRGGNESAVNESFHPLLAWEAALGYLVENKDDLGSMLFAVNAYNTGPGRVRTMLKRAAGQKRASPRADPSPIPALQQFTRAQPLELLPVEERERYAQLDNEAPQWLRQYSAITNWLWQQVPKRIGYGKESSSYVPRMLGYLSAVKLDASAKPFCADRITVEYTGGRALQARGAATAVGTEVFVALNPHVPLAATLQPEMDLFLPPGTAERFYTTHKNVRPSRIARYEHGTIVRA